jgi:hypothetical protein
MWSKIMKDASKWFATETLPNGMVVTVPTQAFKDYREATLAKLKTIRESLDYSKIDVVEIDGIDWSDAPEFCDAYISQATYDGRDMTDEELDAINDDSEFLSEQVTKWIY